MIFRVLGAVFGALLLTWGVLPLFSGVCNVGSIALMVVGFLGTCVSLRFPEVSAGVCRLWQLSMGRVVLCAAAIVSTGLILLFTVVSVRMVCASYREPADGATVIVPGAAVRGDRPSLSLRVRMDAAIQYLQEHPASRCVVSGGQGQDESCTEASVMRAYLIERGIAEDRIAVEEQSTSTYENFLFSKRVIEEKGWNESVAVATQEFHQYRSQQLAQRVGFSNVGAVSAATRWDLLGSYWIRDFFGICRLYLLGE